MMNLAFFRVSAFCGAFSVFCPPIHANQLRVVDSLDLNRYRGIWYEIERLPNSFQKNCKSDVKATYTLMADSRVKVTNTCKKLDGKWTQADGVAKRAEKNGPASKLKVRFAPGFLSFLPFVWGDYWVLELAPDYSYAVIGEPSFKYFWVLSRTPHMDENTLRAIHERAEKQGYDLSSIIRTKHIGLN